MNCNKKYKNYLQYFQVRYFTDSTSPSFPVKDLQFVIGTNHKYKNKKCYKYQYIDSVLGNWTCDRDTHQQKAVSVLSQAQIDLIFQGQSQASLDKLQWTDIQNIQEIISPGVKLNYGVVLDDNLNPIFENGAPVADSPISAYQNGLTAVYPISYENVIGEKNFAFNFNCPAVREYLTRICLKSIANNKSKSLFIDGPNIPYRLIYHNGIFNGPLLNYISPGNAFEQASARAKQAHIIYNAIYNRGRHPSLIYNIIMDDEFGYRLYHTTMQELLNSETLKSFAGLMVENRFLVDGFCTKIDYYLNITEKLKNIGVKIHYCASSQTEANTVDSDFAFRVWLWVHLVADTNTCLGIHADYMLPSVNYEFYRNPIGMPLERPYLDGNVWRRKYQGGEICFDITNKNIRDIRLVI